MKLLLNVIWLVFGGLWLALGYFVAGVIACLLIITIPFGIASFRIGAYALWPFGRRVDLNPTPGPLSLIGNIIWIVFFGLALAIGHLVTGVAMCLTIIGIPLGIANFKLIPVSLLPLGARIVPTDQPFAARYPALQ